MGVRSYSDKVRDHVARLPDVAHRLIAVAPGLITYIVLGICSGNSSVKQWWFFVGIGIAVAAVFVEHHFTSPQDAVVNSVAALGAYASADHAGAEELWDIYVWFAIFTLVCALAATFRFENLVKTLAYKWATMFGRIVVLGGLALLIELSRRSATEQAHTLMFGIGVSVLLLTVATRWYVGLRNWAPKSIVPQVVDALGPGLVLINRVPSSTKPGDLGRIRASDGQTSNVIVATTYPGGDGTRAAVIAESGEWSDIQETFPGNVSFEIRAGSSDLVGVVGPDSASQVIRFDQAAEVRLGETLQVDVEGTSVLFQVVDARLEVHSWDGSRQLAPRAVARQVGVIADGFLRVESRLPLAHASIRRHEAEVVADLPADYIRMGVVATTSVPVGITVDAAARGHLAILGMTGMGKTTVVDRICDTLAESQTVIAIDVTAQYRTRMNWPQYDQESSFGAVGKSVYEMSGEFVLATRNFLAASLQAAKAEYEAGEPKSRFIVLEEAHGLLPEQHISNWDQKEWVGESTRDIMQSRKFGLSFLFVSQRTAVISKSALSQCESYVVFRTLDDTSLSYLESIAGPIVRTIVPALGRYEALCFGPAFNSENPVVVQMDAPLPPASPPPAPPPATNPWDEPPF